MHTTRRECNDYKPYFIIKIMRLDVPFYPQTTEMNCGPYALKMVLAFFGEEISIQILEQRTGIKEAKGVMTIQIATAAALSGYRTEFYSKQLSLNPEHLNLEFYQKHQDLTLDSEKLIHDALQAGVKLEERILSIEKVISHVNEKSIPIVLLDWNIIKGIRGKYHGHFVPIVGYDDTNVYVHNHGLKNPTAFFSIPKELFDEARKAQGTDEDILIVYKEKLVKAL